MTKITKMDLNDLNTYLAFAYTDPNAADTTTPRTIVPADLLRRLLDSYEDLTTEHPSLECSICGDAAFTSSTGHFTDGEGSVCESCGHPGSVVVDEDCETWWNASDELCDNCHDCANEKVRVLTERLELVAKIASQTV